MTVYSSADQLRQIIQSQNPFESHFIVKSHHIWDEDFLDIPSLNTVASETILNTVEKINAGRIKSGTAGFALLAPKGTGKTHILSRIRNQLKRQGKGFFIYVCEYGDLSKVRYQFLQSLASSLKKKGSQGVTQWQELATALISKAMGKTYVAQSLIEQFPKALSRKPQFVDQLTAKIHQIYPDIDNPYIIKAVLWTLSQAHSPFAINWLAGRELSEAQASMMDLPNSSQEDKDAEAFNNARQILELIGYYTTPVICLDQLDGTEVADEDDLTHSGFTRAQVVGSLAMDVYNSLRRGVIVAAMYRVTWREQFLSIISTEAIKDRIHTEIELNPLKPDDVVLLVSSWLDSFYSQFNLTPPHSLYPFEEKKLRALGEERPTVREVLQWCAKNFGSHSDPVEKLKKIYHQIESSLSDFNDDNERIADALAFGFQSLKGQTLEGVTLKEIDREVKPKWKHKGRINFRILGEEKEEDIKIGVCVCQYSNGSTIGAAIKCLTLYKELDLTRGCLVRAKSISKRSQIANSNLNQLINHQGGEWVKFKDEEIKPLLTLHQMAKELDREIFTEKDFYRFIQENYPISENTLIREILSDPSGQAPDELVDEDKELEQLLSEDLINIESGQELENLELLEAALV